MEGMLGVPEGWCQTEQGSLPSSRKQQEIQCLGKQRENDRKCFNVFHDFKLFQYLFCYTMLGILARLTFGLHRLQVRPRRVPELRPVAPVRLVGLVGRCHFADMSSSCGTGGHFKQLRLPKGAFATCRIPRSVPSRPAKNQLDSCNDIYIYTYIHSSILCYLLPTAAVLPSNRIPASQIFFPGLQRVYCLRLAALVEGREKVRVSLKRRWLDQVSI